MSRFATRLIVALRDTPATARNLDAMQSVYSLHDGPDTTFNTNYEGPDSTPGNLAAQARYDMANDEFSPATESDPNFMFLACPPLPTSFPSHQSQPGMSAALNQFHHPDHLVFTPNGMAAIQSGATNPTLSDLGSDIWNDTFNEQYDQMMRVSMFS